MQKKYHKKEYDTNYVNKEFYRAFVFISYCQDHEF